MADLKKYLEEKEQARLGWYFLIAFLLVIVAVDIVTWGTYPISKYHYHLYIGGFVLWIIYYVQSQVIIDKNVFLKYSLIALTLIALGFIKLLFTTFSTSALLGVSFPLIYLGILRLLIWTYFPSYPESEKPILIYYSKGGRSWDGQEEGYRPTQKEKRFSIWTMLFTWALFMIILVAGLGS